MEQNFDIEQAIRDYLPQIIHMSLVTCADAQPWACQVHYAVDDELNIYFCSSVQTRHCQEIELNPKVAGSITTQHFLNQKTRCVSFEGVAERIDDVDESHPGYQAYARRLDRGPQLVQVARKEGTARFYKITVTDFYVSDGYEHNPPQKFHLPWKRIS